MLMKTFTMSSVLAFAHFAESRNIIKEKYQELFLKDHAPEKQEGVDGKPSIKQDAQIEDGTISLNVGEILNAFGITSFVCQDPVGFSDGDFSVADLEGTWYQTYASRATDSYGCLSYTITPVPDADTGDLPAVDISAAWSAFNTYWNPFQKGQYARKYELYGDTNGRLFERNLTTRANTYSYIIASDNSSP